MPHIRCCFLLSLLLASDASADPGAPMRWNGRASVGAIAASGNHDLDETGARAGLAGRVRMDIVGNAGKGTFEAAAFGPRLGYESSALIRQAFWSADAGPANVRVGRQIIAWGRADRINPSDNLSPRNRRALVTDSDEERIGIDMVSASWNMTQGVNLSAFWAPRMPAGAIPRGVAQPLIGDTLRPSTRRRTLAYKLDYAGNGFDGSLSVLDGPSLLPVLAFDGMRIGTERPSYRITAGDFSWQFAKSWGLRGELAATRFATAASGAPARSGGIADFRFGVLGVERQFDDGWTVIGQYLARRVADDASASTPPPLRQLNRTIWFQARGSDDALMIGATKSPFDGDWSGDIGAVRSLRSNDMALFLRFEWRFYDTYSLRLRHETFRGTPDTNFGALRRDSASIVELRATWGW